MVGHNFECAFDGQQDSRKRTCQAGGEGGDLLITEYYYNNQYCTGQPSETNSYWHGACSGDGYKFECQTDHDLNNVIQQDGLVTL